ncbi:hypothetical protein EU557_07875 [Hymenobacter wooponensis]|uniref:Uncharacterized protein n=1 Tax=Hymenobacter wooponensis TaxID=1525360 RepID=A0A4Z0MQ46_9BACT|nr:hypothetical protein EU557_07875 [Hymenobacter wooponensis]
MVGLTSKLPLVVVVAIPSPDQVYCPLFDPVAVKVVLVPEHIKEALDETVRLGAITAEAAVDGSFGLHPL